MSFLFINKVSRLSNLKTSTAMDAKYSMFVTCVEVIIYLLLCNFHDWTFNVSNTISQNFWKSSISFTRFTSDKLCNRFSLNFIFEKWLHDLKVNILDLNFSVFFFDNNQSHQMKVRQPCFYRTWALKTVRRICKY